MKRIFLTIIILSGLVYAQEIKNIIHPLSQISGITDSVIVTDLFYVKNYNLKFKPAKNIEFSYSPSTKILYVATKKGFEGLGLIKFTMNNKNYAIPHKSGILQERTFKYKPAGKVKKVFEVYGVNHLMGNIVNDNEKIRFMAFADGDIETGNDNN